MESQMCIEYLSNLEKCVERLEVLRNIDDNWDGYGASKPSNQTVDRAIIFLRLIYNKKPYLLKYLHHEDICPMPYGTIVMDFERQKDKKCLSFEVGKTRSDYFICYN